MADQYDDIMGAPMDTKDHPAHNLPEASGVLFRGGTNVYSTAAKNLTPEGRKSFGLEDSKDDNTSVSWPEDKRIGQRKGPWKGE